MISDEFTDKEQLDENLRKWFKEKWVRFGPDGKIRGPCARGDDSEGKPKCLPQKKAHSIGKKGRKYAASKKRREDPNPERRGKAKNVATKKKSNEDIQVNEKWSQKYKDSINCSNPKGFSQKAHCAGKKKNEDMNENIPFNQCPSCRGPIVHESMINEKKDACYHKVRSRYKVWPSAYASGALVQCRKKGASNWGNKSKKNESSIMKGIVDETAYEAELQDNEPRIVIGVYGAKSKEFRKKFANQKAQDRFFDHPDREGNYEIHYVQKATVSEGVIVGHDANDPEVAILGGAGTMSLSRLKNKAAGEAQSLFHDMVLKGNFKAAAYNIKQLANTLNTIVAAEEEMSKKYFGENKEIIDEAKMSDIVNPLVKAFNLEHGAEERWSHFSPLHIKNSFRRWRRGDGSYYVDPSRIVASSDENVDERKLQREFFGWLTQQPGVKPAGKIRGEFRSSDYADAVKYKGLIFINRGSFTEFTTSSRLRNSDVWHQKTDEDYTGEFAAEKTAATNPYGGLKDAQNRGAIGESMDEARAPHPLLKAANKNLAGLASGEVQRRERERKAAEKAQRQASKDLDRMLNRKPAKKTKQDLQTLWAKIESVIANSFPDGEPYDQLWPYMQKHGFTQDDVERASKMNGYDDLWDYWNTLTQDIENDAYADWQISGGKNVRTRGTFVETPTDNPTGASGEGGWRKYKPKSAGITESYPSNVKQYARDLAREMREEGYDWEPVNLSDAEGAIDDAREQLSMFASSNMCDFFGDYDPSEQLKIIKMFNKKFGGIQEEKLDEYRGMSPALKAAQQNLIALRNKEKAVSVPGKRERTTRDKVEIDTPKPAAVLAKGSQDVDPATQDAIAAFLAKGGEIKKGRPGKAPPVGRNQASKHIGGGGKYRKKNDTPGQGANYRGAAIVAVEEEQLDEKCWTGYKQVGMKNKGGKQVPNCVPKESAIMKGLKR